MRSAWCRILFFTTVMMAGGCDAGFDPFVEEERFFVISGYLDAASDSQFVRLNTLREQVLIDTTVDISVHSTHLNSRQKVQWQDSLVRLDNGTLGRLFYALFVPKNGGTYELTAKAPDIRTKTVQTTVPDSLRFQRGRVDTLCSGIDKDIIQFVKWENVSRRPAAAVVHYSVQIPETGQLRRIPIDYGEAPARISTCSNGEVSGQGIYAINLETDRVAVTHELNRTPGDPSLILRDVSMDLTMLSADWGGSRSFFGSVTRPHAQWMPPLHAVEGAGFSAPSTPSTPD